MHREQSEQKMINFVMHFILYISVFYSSLVKQGMISTVLCLAFIPEIILWHSYFLHGNGEMFSHVIKFRNRGGLRCNLIYFYRDKY